MSCPIVPPMLFAVVLFAAAGCAAGAGPGEPTRPDPGEKVIARGGGCFHKSRTACIEYSTSFKPGDVRRQCVDRDVETFLPTGCPEANRLGRCFVRGDMVVFFYDKLSSGGAARVCRNSFRGRWVSDGQGESGR